MLRMLADLMWGSGKLKANSTYVTLFKNLRSGFFNAVSHIAKKFDQAAIQYESTHAD